METGCDKSPTLVGGVLLLDGTKNKLVFSVTSGEAYGLCTHLDYVFVAVRGYNPRIFRLDKNFQVDRFFTLPVKSDPHCVYVEDDHIFMISSSEDAIYKFSIGLEFIEKKKYGFGGDYRFHVNDVTRIGSEFFVSMFTDKPTGHHWNHDIPQGLVKYGSKVNPLDMNSTMTNLIKPHSPTLFKDDLLVCNSGCGSVYVNNNKLFEEKGSWTRGLCVEADYVHAGVSDFDRTANARVVTITKSGDIVRDVKTPFSYIYEIKLLG